MSSNPTTTTDEFIKASGVEEILSALKATIAQREANGQKFIVSDVYDNEGNQYVDLVQEGGGVWGVALLGYTYILEKMGIRFFSLAGTSAGAINTMLMAAIHNKEEPKTEKIIAVFLQLNMFGFVDGKKDNWKITRWIKKIIQQFILKKNYLSRVKKTFKIIVASLVFFSFLAPISAFTPFHKLTFWLSITSISIWILVIILLIFLFYRIKTIAKTGYGLNEGRAFYVWMSKILHDHKIDSLEDLKIHFCKTPPDLKVRRDANRDLITEQEIKPPSSPMLVIVASDISTGNKIEFPRMWKMYWPDLKSVNPASFVRASMSIPIFFETYKIPVQPSSNAKEIWKDLLNWNGEIPKQVELVDGGVLSNFPINVFYNSKYIIPRMPTFGIRLGGSGINEAKQINSAGAYFSSLLSTLRSNTDKDFINKNKAFELAVKEVDLSEYSWLNFFMNDKDKQAIFKKGAQAASDFILNFNWEDYKRQRLNNNEVLQSQQVNPNNW